MSYHTIFTQKHSLSRIVIALLTATPLTSQAASLAFSVADRTQTVSGCNALSIELNRLGELKFFGGNATCQNGQIDILGCQNLFTDLTLKSNQNPVLRATQSCIKTKTTGGTPAPVIQPIVQRDQPITLELQSNTNTQKCSSQTLELSSDGQLRVKGLDCFGQLNPSPSVSKNLILSGNNGESIECLFKGLTLNANGSLSVDTNDSCLETGPSNPNPASDSQQLGTVKQVSHQATVLPNTQAFNQNNSIILAGVPSSKGGQPGAIQLTDEGQGDIKARFREWAYLDETHLSEQFDYAVLDKGCYLNDEQNSFIVGSFTHTIDRNWKDVFPHHSFPNNCFASQDKPITSVFMTIQPSQDPGEPVVVRARDLSDHKFQAALFEDKAITGQNRQDRTESFTIGYIAFYGNQNRGNIPVNGTEIPFSIQTLKVNHNWTQTSGFSPVQHIRLQEDENPAFGLIETRHNFETVKVLNIGNKLFAQDISFSGKQPFVFRRR